MSKKVHKTLNLEFVGKNGNAFFLMGVFQKQARREGWSEEDIQTVLTEAKAGDYNHLLNTLVSYCQPKHPEEDE